MSTITRQQAQQIIDAADAVITALAGTNEDVHRDNSTKMVQLYDDLNDHYAPPEVVRELARIALASLEAEPVADDIDARMKDAGMLSAAEIISGQPIDTFMRHAGVVDLESLLRWAEMRRAEFLRMQAKYELGDNPKDDMYEWVISHVAAFSELHVNIRAAMLHGADGKSTVVPDCWCRTCRPVKLNAMRFVVCPECGNKRCPHANDHRNACTGSNEPGQEGSAYPAAPQQEGADGR